MHFPVLWQIDENYGTNYYGTIHWDKAQMLKKMSFRRNKRCKKMHSSSTHHSFTFYSGFLYELKRNVHLSKNVYGIFHFQFCFGFIRVYIFVQQKHELFDFKTSWFSSKLKQVAARSFKIQWYLRELLISKNWPGQGFFKLWKSRCFSRVTFNWVFGV